MLSAPDLRQAFRALSPLEPILVRAPGRVNLIGEHTDYNDGFVMPAALVFETRAVLAPRQDRRLRVRSRHTGLSAEFDLDAPRPTPLGDWTDYVFGVAVALAGAGHRLVGADILIDTSVPIGSGLSSSAALEVSVGYGLLALAGETIDPVALAVLCQRAENEFVGMRCGVMDQYISCCGEIDHALLIDCRSLEGRPVPVGREARIVVANSMVRHAHAGGEYNRRRASCEEGVAALAARLGPIAALRDVTPGELEAHRDALSEETFRRCRHVVTENARVLAAAEALTAGDVAAFGALMDASHASMRDDYEITCPEVDTMVEIARALPGVHGARMTGGGFGGCTVSLVAAEAAEAFMTALAERYAAATGLQPTVFACSPQAGVGRLHT